MTKYRIMQDHPDRFYAEQCYDGLDHWILVLGTVETTAERAETKLREIMAPSYGIPFTIKELEL